LSKSVTVYTLSVLMFFSRQSSSCIWTDVNWVWSREFFFVKH